MCVIFRGALETRIKRIYQKFEFDFGGEEAIVRGMMHAVLCTTKALPVNGKRIVEGKILANMTQKILR